MRHSVTGHIGISRYPQLLEMIARGDVAVAIGAALGVDPETVRKFARKRGLKIQAQDMSLTNHPCWGGGTVLDRSGYQLQRVLVDSPHGYLIRALGRRGKTGTPSSGYAPTHRIVMHDMIGRPLVRGEVVDHIDGNVRNNSPENLHLFASNSEHLRVTLKGKVPNWTDEGKARNLGRPRKSRPPVSPP